MRAKALRSTVLLRSAIKIRDFIILLLLFEIPADSHARWLHEWSLWPRSLSIDRKLNIIQSLLSYKTFNDHSYHNRRHHCNHQHHRHYQSSSSSSSSPNIVIVIIVMIIVVVINHRHYYDDWHHDHNYMMLCKQMAASSDIAFLRPSKFHIGLQTIHYLYNVDDADDYNDDDDYDNYDRRMFCNLINSGWYWAFRLCWENLVTMITREVTWRGNRREFRIIIVVW